MVPICRKRPDHKPTILWMGPSVGIDPLSQIRGSLSKKLSRISTKKIFAACD
jgi:hypothetical protein